MLVGVPKEIKNHEYRVGLTPAGVHALTFAGHEVLVETNADANYLAAGARIATNAAEVYGRAKMVVKVKELQAAEFLFTQPGQILFAYQHFAPDPDLLQHVIDSGLSCVAYETVADAQGELPLLAPMSGVAGRLAPQVGAQVTLFDRGIEKIAALDRIYRGRITTCVADPLALEHAIVDADLVVGAVLIPGKLSPKLISRTLLRKMRPGSVIVDVGIDQGGIAETSRPTSHTNPIFVEKGIVHYCVPNMSSAVARTATLADPSDAAVCAATGHLGLRRALEEDTGLMESLQVHAGLAEDTGRAFTPARDVLRNS